MNSIIVDFNSIIGEIKPMHGVGQPPILGYSNCKMFDYLKDANIPYSRLHDVGGAYGGNRFVDIPNLFRDFDADEEDIESYDFAFTDILIKELMDRNIEPVFRLGVTIENACKIKAYRIYPPKDYAKWARICEHVIMHYTCGWANGFNYDIKYWEIWNEPDNFEVVCENQMWRGTKEQYFELYNVVSKHLKAKFPHLKIGGYGSCGFYAISDEKSQFGNCSPRSAYFIEFFIEFFRYIKANNCPIDFFSWHSYSSIENNLVWSEYVNEMLEEFGFANLEHTLNEWNCQPDLKGTLKHAALTAGMMLALQNTSLSSAMFYDAKCGMGTYSGMFNCMTYEPLPAYYSFVAFGELFVRKNQVKVSCDIKDVYCLAAKGDDGCIVIANTGDEKEISLDFQGEITECKAIMENSIWDDFNFNNTLPENSVLMIKVK